MGSNISTSAISSWATVHIVLVVVGGGDYKYFRNTRILEDFCVQVSDLVSFRHLFGHGIRFLIFGVGMH